MLVLFAPFSIAFDSSHNYISVLVGYANLSSIRAPLHVTYDAGFAVVDHFLDPLSVVFHEDDDGAGGVASGEFAILFIPDNYGDIALVVW